MACASSTSLAPLGFVTHDLAEASLHLHVGLAVLMDVGFAVLTAEPKFVIDLEGGGEHLSKVLDAPFPL